MDSFYRYKIVEGFCSDEEEYTISEETRTEIDFVLDYNNLSIEAKDFYNKLLELYNGSGKYLFRVADIEPFGDSRILNKILSELIDTRYIRMMSGDQVLLDRTRADSVMHGGGHGLHAVPE